MEIKGAAGGRLEIIEVALSIQAKMFLENWSILSHLAACDDKLFLKFCV